MERNQDTAKIQWRFQTGDAGESGYHFKGICVANPDGNHIVSIKDGKNFDLFDSTNGCTENYRTMN